MTHETIAALLSSSPSATLDDSHPHYPILRIANAHGEAAVALHGAHLIDYRPNIEQPLLYLSPSAIFTEGTPIRGGVPICWPWFSAHPSDATQPSHGVARDRFWDLEGVEDGPDGATTLTFSLPSTAIPASAWPHRFELTYTITVGRSLDLALTTINRATRAFAVGGALHAYLAVSAADKVRIDGLEGCAYQDTALGGTERRQEGPIRIDREVDRIYREPAPVVSLLDRAWQRRIQVEGTGSRTTVIWNPGPERSASLPDLPEDGWRHFVCIETANAGEDIPLLEPGAYHTLGCRIGAAPAHDDPTPPAAETHGGVS